jgi:hypothetical protein
LITALQEALKAFPETPTSLDWRSQLAELQGDTPEGKATLEGTVALCEALIKDPVRMKKFNKAEPAGDYLGIESLKVYEARAEAIEAEKKPAEEVKKAWTAGVEEGARLDIKDEPTGKFYRFLTILKKAGENKRVEHFFQKYLAKSPQDPELLRRYSKFLYDNGRFQEAAEKSLASIAGSYDQNEIFAATLYAKSLAKEGQGKKAKDFLLSYDQRPNLSARSRKEVESTLTQIQ